MSSANQAARLMPHATPRRRRSRGAVSCRLRAESGDRPKPSIADEARRPAIERDEEDSGDEEAR
jgi:hypothetical protein